jgi:hypothetical protein
MKQRKVALGAATAVLASVAILVGGVAANAATMPTPSPSASVTSKPIPTQSALANPRDVYTDPQWSLYDYDTSNNDDEAMLSAASQDAATPLGDLGKTGGVRPTSTAPPMNIVASINPDVEPIVAKSANGPSMTAVTYYLSVSSPDYTLNPELTGYSTITILLDATNNYVGSALQVITYYQTGFSNPQWWYAALQSWSITSGGGRYRVIPNVRVSPLPTTFLYQDDPAPSAVYLSNAMTVAVAADQSDYDNNDYVAASALSETVAAQQSVNADSYPLWSSSLMG